MISLPVAFTTPWVLLGLVTLPLIWWLLRLTPPKPKQEAFPPTRLLSQIPKQEETPAHSPWWLVLLRLAMAALVILAMAGPTWNPQKPIVTGKGPLLLVLDNSWASGSSWEQQTATASRIIDQAKIDERSITLLAAVGIDTANQVGISAQQAKTTLQALKPQPVRANWEKSITIVRNMPDQIKPTSVIWLSAGLDSPEDNEFSEVLNNLSADEFLVYVPNLEKMTALTRAANDPTAMVVDLVRPIANSAMSGELKAFDTQGRPLAKADYKFDSEKLTTTAKFELPVEFRNDFARIELNERNNAGAVQLLDDRFQRRRVGLISGENSDLSQPLLSPLYYISRALGPYSELLLPDNANIADAANTLMEDQVSAMVMADIGTISSELAIKLDNWVKKGGMLVRFAGPRLAASTSNALIPVQLRKGGRNLAGSLTWGTPQQLASFNPQSPFAGLSIPKDVTVSRQVLAEPTANLPQSTWASLADGTPLVTANKRGNGWIVLFHVTANATWSNLALSGSFVEMLRRIVQLSGNSIAENKVSGKGKQNVILPPYRILDGFGLLESPPATAKPLVLQSGATRKVSFENPPGQYGSSDGFVVQNLLDRSSKLTPLKPKNLSKQAVEQMYVEIAPTNLVPWLLVSALVLMSLDCIAVLWMAGLLSRRIITANALAILIGLVIISQTENAIAQDKNTTINFEATLSTRLAYVITGIAEIDEISRQGLTGLTRYISSRTSLEPGPPVGVDISVDELSFYPLIYWPIDPDAQIPDIKSMARIDAFMKKGGSVIFDTKDALSGGFGGTTISSATQRLREILADLDIPPLERIPTDHVLTKAFYLLNIFPGRYNADTMWVEASEPTTNDQRPVRIGDGVSSIMITSNDLAGAWAIDDNGRPLLPTVPPSPLQRTFAFRVGVNLAMYTLTGNYKSDQVHIPALLERLGQ